uniref:NADH-ubiquinone oxidoreductase chain 3 n=1 Tax=Chiropsalmus quadrumanus TaxID=645347 RepID=G9IT44_9CNID|nr:NADH dehydrogenase subunit 3 [Chiropsalmus quadrumanus]
MNQLSMLISILLSSFLCSIIAGAAWLLTNKSPDKEKLSPYECGFNPFNQSGHPVSIKFFLIAILFLVFDLEVVLILPWSVTTGLNFVLSQTMVWGFIIFLAWGLVYEWLAGGLEWE